ncbi:ABC transporter ATP-binding protein [Hoeflea sp. WL0058]|uniref:ABC transporter ATP-binding protein n=1 Tax=Flavimaribacter sediminis TaxID=2865987 RepID=A0AAE2ZPY0_9HYPH|nr:ABC transporter ATP-binding protein [Flavimaribacter sediminis]
MLKVSNLSVSYGPIPALRDISLEIGEGDTLAVVGANGAGKSTLTLAIAGAVRPALGTIEIAGTDITGWLPEKVAFQNIALVPEGRHIFEGLTVEENLLLGMTARKESGSTASAFDEVYSMFPVLRERRTSQATRLSGGEQQQLAIARALLSKPRLLILDEPSLGLAPIMVDTVYTVLKKLKEIGVAMLLVEQNPARIGEIADHVIVLTGGSVALSGRPEILERQALEDAYFGTLKAATP